MVQEICLQDFLSGALAALLFRSGTIYANLKEDIMGEHSCEVISNLDQWFRICRLKDLLSGALVALLFSGAEPLTQF